MYTILSIIGFIIFSLVALFIILLLGSLWYFAAKLDKDPDYFTRDYDEEPKPKQKRNNT